MFNDDRDPLYLNKNEHYREFLEVVVRLMERLRRDVVRELKNELREKQIGGEFWQHQRELWEAQIMAMFVAMASAAASAELGIPGSGLPDIDIAELNQPIADWARRHSGSLVKDVFETTRQGIGDAVAAYYETPGMTIGDVIEQISEHGYLFHPSRAEMIAVTEVTRAYSEGQLAVWNKVERDYAVATERIWNTNNDDKVCVICEPLNRQPETPEGGFDPSGVGPGIPFPPAHPRCRCWLTQRIRKT